MQVYHSDDYLVECLADYVADGLNKHEQVIIVATRAHEEALGFRLASKGIRLAEEVEAGRVVSLEAGETLPQVMKAGAPDQEAFDRTIGEMVRRAAGGGKNVRVFGELVDLLWRDGFAQAAVRLEECWNALRAQARFMLFCAYPAKFGNPGADHAAAAAIRQAHSAILIGGK
jgi:hypothetical protein